MVLSDVTDGESEAELSGPILNLHSDGTQTQPAVAGIALFMKGFSSSAFDDPKVEETIKLRDGTTVTGRLIDANDESIQINVVSKKRDIAIKDIVDVQSPRCLAFSVPVTVSGSATSSQSAGQSTLVKFQPNYAPKPASISTLLPTTAMLEGQLTEHHAGKKMLEYSAGLAFLTACFAIPIVLAISTTHLNPNDVKKLTDIVRVNVREGKLDNKTK